jgi:hypothetical protein
MACRLTPPHLDTSGLQSQVDPKERTVEPRKGNKRAMAETEAALGRQ